MKKILITGICGFIGHHIAEHFLINTDFEVVGIDKLTYASNGFNRLRDTGCLGNPRLKVYPFDFTYPITLGLAREIGDVDYILHVGAETHVDRSIEDPEPFVFSNVVGTMRILDYAKTQSHLEKFFYFSTDEVFGPAPVGVFYKEDDRFDATNPYSATKGAGELLVKSYINSYRLPAIITRCMNCFGERQHPEKFIPSTIKKILNKETVFIHIDKITGTVGSRFYIHCRNVAAALLFLINNSSIGEDYHIIGEREVNNLDLALFISEVLNIPFEYKMIPFAETRPGHDLRYALDGDKMKQLGWVLPKDFKESLTKTILWYADNQNWLEW